MRDITLAWDMENTQLNQSHLLWRQIYNSISQIETKLQGIQNPMVNTQSINDLLNKINQLNKAIDTLFSSFKGILRTKPNFDPIIAKINDLLVLLKELKKNTSNIDIKVSGKGISSLIAKLESLDKAMKNMNNKLTIVIDTTNAINNVKDLNKELQKSINLFNQINQQSARRRTAPSPGQSTTGGGGSAGVGGGMGRTGGMPGMQGMPGMSGGLGGALGKLGPYAQAASQALGMVTDAVKGAYNAVLGLDDLVDDFSNNKIVKAVSMYEKYEAALYTLSGSHIEARQSLANLQNFAKSTPFEFEEITQTYIKLANRGVNASNEMLTSLGDIAAAQGKSIDQMTEAFLDGQMGQYRRFIEFGIKVSKEGNDVVLKMGSKVGKGKDMEAAIKELAKQGGVIGGMANQSVSLGGQISNVTDGIQMMFTKIGQIPLVRKGFEMFLQVIGFVVDKISLLASKLNVVMGPFKDSLFDQEAVQGEMEHFFYGITESQQQSMRGISKHLKVELNAMAKAATEANKGHFESMKSAGIEMSKEGDKIIAKMGNREVVGDSAEDAIDKLSRFTYEVEKLTDTNQVLWDTFDSGLQQGLINISSNANINMNKLTEATNEAYKGTDESFNKLRALGFKITEEQGVLVMEMNGKIVKAVDANHLLQKMGDLSVGMSDLSEEAKFLGVDWKKAWDDMMNFDYKGLWQNIVNWDWIKDLHFDWGWIWRAIDSLAMWVLMDLIPWVLSLVWDLIKFVFIGLVVLIGKAIAEAFYGIVEYVKMRLQQIYLVYKPILDPLIAIFKEIYNTIVSIFTNLYDKIKKVIVNIYNSISDTSKSIYTSITDFFKSIYDYIAKIFIDIYNVIAKYMTMAFEYVKKGFDIWLSMWTYVYDFIKSIFTKITDLFSNLASYLSNIITPIIDWFKNIFTELFDSFTSWIMQFELVRNAMVMIKEVWASIVKGISEGIEYMKSLFDRFINYIPNLLKSTKEVVKNAYKSVNELEQEEKDKKKKPLPKIIECKAGTTWNPMTEMCEDDKGKGKKDEKKDEDKKKPKKMEFVPRDIEKERDINKWSDSVFALVKADEDLRKATIDLHNKKLDEKAKPEEIAKLEQAITEKQWAKENIMRDTERKNQEEQAKVAMNLRYAQRKDELEKTAILEKWSNEKRNVENHQMEVDKLEEEFFLKKTFHAVELQEIQDNESKIKEKKMELAMSRFKEERKLEEDKLNLANEVNQKKQLEILERQINSQLISKEEGEVRKLQLEMDTHEKTQLIKEQFNHTDILADQKYTNERIDLLNKLYKAELDLLLANENKKLELITEATDKKIKALEREFEHLSQIQDRYAKIIGQAKEITELIKANSEIALNDQKYNDKLSEYIAKRQVINEELLKATKDNDKNSINIFQKQLKDLNEAFNETESQYMQTSDALKNKITDMAIEFFTATKEAVKTMNEDFKKQSNDSLANLSKQNSKLEDTYKKGVDLTTTGHKVIQDGINHVTDTLGEMLNSIDEYNKKLEELSNKKEEYAQLEEMHANNAIESDKKRLELIRKRAELEFMLSTAAPSSEQAKQIESEIKDLDFAIFNEEQRGEASRNASKMGKEAKDAIQKQMDSVNFDKYVKQIQSAIKAIEDVFNDIEQRRLENIDKMIDKHKQEMEAIKAKAEEEKKLLDMENQRQAVINMLAEQRIKELTDLSKNVPAAQKERIEKEIAEERKKIKTMDKEKDKAKRKEEKRLQEEQDKIKQLEEEKKKIQREQFEVSRVAKIVDITMNTAQAISKAYAQGGLYATIFVPLIVAMGAVQIATVASQPNPYNKGTLSVEGSGDVDSVHAILTPGEAVIPKHTNEMYHDTIESIFTHQVPANILNDFVKNYKIKKVDMMGGMRIQNDNIVHIDIERLIKTIENKKMVSVNIDSDGINTYINSTNTKSKILDKKLHKKL